MPQIQYRKMDFRFDDDIPFQFNPANIALSNMVNSTTFMAPAFESYFIKAFREAMPLLRDERLKHDTEIFIQQEREHSKHHLAHLRMLLRKFPELEQVRDDVNASYRRLYDSHPLEFHLAYTATVELATGPMARFTIENRDVLYGGGDPRITSFFLWHALEEFEHRNCAIDVFNEVVGSHLYRLRQVRETRTHLLETGAIVRRAFRKLAAEGKIASADKRTSDGVSRLRRWRLYAEILGTLLPWHNPDRLKQPQWLTQWMSDYAAGKPMEVAYEPPNLPHGLAN